MKVQQALKNYQRNEACSMTQQQLVITLLSDNKPGIVKTVADIIVQQQGNWLESQMAELAGKFAGILTVSIEDKRTTDLINALKALNNHGVQVLIDQAPQSKPSIESSQFSFELAGPDRMGIISEISQAFAHRHISIDHLETRCSSSPWSGEPLFEAIGTLIAPASLHREDLIDQLNTIEDQLGIDIVISETL